VLSWTVVAVGLASSTLIVVDTIFGGYRQPVKVMEIVWPVTALYLGPVAIAIYWNWGRSQTARWRQRHGNPPKRSRRATVLLHLCHCGAHCTLGTIIAALVVFAVGITLAGDTLWAICIGGYFLAVAIGVAFRYSATVFRGVERIRATMMIFAKADLVSISVFEFAVFIWLALTDHVFFPNPPLRPSSPVFWFLAQVGLIAGFLAAWPITLWVVHRGVKVDPHGMPE